MSHYEFSYADRRIRENTTAYREYLGMTQSEFIAHLDGVISRGTLSHIEAGDRVINNLRFVEKLAQKSGKTIEQLRSAKVVRWGVDEPQGA